MRKLIRLAVGLVLVLVGAGIAFWYYVDVIAKTGIERGATYALGVPTTVHRADVGLFGGTLLVENLRVGNPEGFETPHLLALKQSDLGVVTNTLWKDTIQVNRFELDGLDLYIEQKPGTSNVSTVLEHIRSKTGSPGEPEEEGAGGKKVKVDRIVVRNVTAHVQVLPIGGQATTVDVEVPEIILEDVTSDTAEGVAVAELTRRILPAILTAVIKKGRGTIPEMDLDRLAADVGETTRALGEQARDLVEQVGKDAGGLLDKVFKGGEEGKGGLGDTLKDILKKKDGEGGETEGGGLLEGILKPKEKEGEEKESGLLDGLLKPPPKEQPQP
ncbi:MAG: hypothetical protein R6X20_17855 [Phycisphaerae bacterium]